MSWHVFYGSWEPYLFRSYFPRNLSCNRICIHLVLTQHTCLRTDMDFDRTRFYLKYN